MVPAISLASVYFLGSVAAGLLAVRTRENHSLVARELFGLAVCVAEWSFFYGLETLSTTSELRELWSQLAYVGTYAAVAFMLRFCIRWLNPRLAGWWMSTLWIVPIGMVVAAFTNGLHGLVWPTIEPSELVPFVYRYGHGPLFWVGTVYQYLAVVASAVVILVGVVRRRGIYRQQALLVFSGLMVAVAGNVFYVSGALEPIPLDITPLTLTAATGFLLAGISRARLLELLPTARHRVVDLMPDGLIVVDERCRVVDWNVAALSLWGIDQASIMGTPIGDLIPGWSDAVPRELPGAFAGTLVRRLEDGRRYVDVEIRRLDGTRSAGNGWIVLFHDATDLRAAEQRLQDANDRLEQLNAELSREAVRDGLTGLFNRAYLDDSLPREFARAHRESRPVGLLILDVDFFKEINDQFGHDEGDEVLRRVAELVQGQVRTGDIPCRYGGDEFVVVMPGASFCEALRIGERIRASVGRADLGSRGARVASTVSVGVAVYPDHAATAAELFRSADRALYQAKDHGRDRVHGARDV